MVFSKDKTVKGYESINSQDSKISHSNRNSSNLHNYPSENLGGIYSQSPEDSSDDYKDSLLTNIRKSVGEWNEKHPKASKAMKVVGLAAAGGAIALGIYSLASSPAGYSITRLPSTPETGVKELYLNPVLHPISHAIKEGSVKFSQEVGNVLGPVKILIHDMKMSVEGVSMDKLIEDQVRRSSNINAAWHLFLGELTSFGGEKIYRMAKRK